MFKCIVVEENEVTTALGIINKNSRKVMEIANCGWKDEPTKWFIAFKSSKKNMDTICKELETMAQK